MSSRAPSQFLLLGTVLVVTINLRPAITVVGPLIETIGADTGLSPTLLGLLGAIPVIAFALVSPTVHLLGARFGLEPTIFGALLLLTGGTLLRAAPQNLLLSTEASLFLGTVVLAAAIGVGNVLVPAVVKRDFPDRVPLMTGIYTATMVGAAAGFSAAAVPLAELFDWPGALAAPAVMALLGAAAWTLRRGRRRQQRALAARTPAAPSMCTAVIGQPLAWQVTVFFGLQSSLFFVLLTWFPAVQTWHGAGQAQAGFWLAVFQAVGVLSSLVIGHIMQRTRDQRGIATVITSFMLIGLLGMIHLPQLMPVWALSCGLASGALLMLGLSFISLRAGTPAQVGRLSSMVQGFGYLLAAAGPVMAGTLYEAAGTWTPVLWACTGLAALLLIAGLFAGRSVQLHS